MCSMIRIIYCSSNLQTRRTQLTAQQVDRGFPWTVLHLHRKLLALPFKIGLNFYTDSQKYSWLNF